MAASACRPQTLFESATVAIQHCPDCQMIHLTMGSITMRMSEHHFSEFAKDIGKGFFEFNSLSQAHNQPGLRLLM
jgi:hypothetical protein